MRKLWLAFVFLYFVVPASAQSITQFRYKGTTIISSSTFTSALIAPAIPGEQNLITHWFAEPTSGATVSFWASINNNCTPAIPNSGITSMVVSNNQPIMDGSGDAPIAAAPIGDAICAQDLVAPIPGLVTYGIVP